jgi:hypothetical protein
MLKDDVAEQWQRLRRRVRAPFATLPLPLATYIPPFVQRISHRQPGAVAAFGAGLLTIAVVYYVLASLVSSDPARVIIQPQWVPPPSAVPAATTTTAAPTTTAVPTELLLESAQGRMLCEVYWDSKYTRATNETTCGVVDVAHQIVCLHPAVAQTAAYGGRYFWRTPVIYHTGSTQAVVSARLTQCPDGPVTATVSLPYSVIYFDATDHKRRITIQDDACLQLFIMALHGAQLCPGVHS